MSEKTRTAFKLLAIGALTTLVRIVRQLMIPAGEQAVLSPSVFVLTGTMPLAFTVYGVVAYALIASLFLVVRDGLTGPGRFEDSSSAQPTASSGPSAFSSPCRTWLLWTGSPTHSQTGWRSSSWASSLDTGSPVNAPRCVRVIAQEAQPSRYLPSRPCSYWEGCSSTKVSASTPRSGRTLPDLVLRTGVDAAAVTIGRLALGQGASRTETTSDRQPAAV